MNRIKLFLLALPVFLASVLFVASPASATEVTQPPVVNTVGIVAKPLFEVVFEQPTPETPMLEFTDAEANAAIERFGCDCNGCLNSVRLLQGRLPYNK